MARRTDSIISRLAEDYPLLYLNPDEDDRETYRRVVLKGENPGKNSLDHYQGHRADRIETIVTPAGPVRTVTLGDRRDFERVLRGLMAAKSGPDTAIPPTQGAAMLTVFNWSRIHKHLARFSAEEQNAEFARFTTDKKNYLDMLIVLSRGGYSHISAEEAGFQPEEWLTYSDTIRRYHELTHVICRRLYPQDIQPLRDELIADAVGLTASFGFFDGELEKKFLGIREGLYTGGRLENYTDKPEDEAGNICRGIGQIDALIRTQKWGTPFDLIPPLMELPITERG